MVGSNHRYSARTQCRIRELFWSVAEIVTDVKPSLPCARTPLVMHFVVCRRSPREATATREHRMEWTGGDLRTGRTISILLPARRFR